MVSVATSEEQFRRLGWLIVVAALFCVTSVVVLTLLLPHESAGGFLPIPAPTSAGR